MCVCSNILVTLVFYYNNILHLGITFILVIKNFQEITVGNWPSGFQHLTYRKKAKHKLTSCSTHSMGKVINKLM